MTVDCDIHALVSEFRLANRVLFNQFFRVDGDPYHGTLGWDLHARFVPLEVMLFNVMVTEPARARPVPYRDVQKDILVAPRSGGGCPALINREIDGGYWDHPAKEVTTDATLKFLTFFDWDQLGVRDNAYVRVVIAAWPGCRELVGKHALLQWHYAKVTQIINIGNDLD